MLDTYANVPRHSAVFIAEKRDFIDRAEMAEAVQTDAAEPAAHKAWRHILELNGRMRHAIHMLRLARENCGAGYRKIELYPGTYPGWFESRPWTQEFLNECLAEVLWIKADRAAAWRRLHTAEACQ